MSGKKTKVEEDKGIGARTNIRFPPDPNTLAWVAADLETKSFSNALVGLTVNESHKGSSIVLLASDALHIGQRYKLLVGKLAPVEAELRWLKEIDAGVVRAGFEYTSL